MPVRLLVLGFMAFMVAFGVQTRDGFAQPLTACDRPLIVRASEAYAPFSMKDAGGSAVGFDNTFITRVLSSIGCKARFVFLPWKRSLYEVREGQIDILPSASFTQERAEYGLFSQPYRNDVSGFLVRRGDARKFLLTGLGDLLKYDIKIGHVRGAYRGEEFEKFSSDPQNMQQVVDVPIASHGLNLLLSRRIDMLLGIPFASFAQAEERGLDHLVEIHPFVLGKEPIRLMYSRQTIAPELVSLIDKAIDREIALDRYRDLYGHQAISAE